MNQTRYLTAPPRFNIGKEKNYTPRQTTIFQSLTMIKQLRSTTRGGVRTHVTIRCQILSLVRLTTPPLWCIARFLIETHIYFLSFRTQYFDGHYIKWSIIMCGSVTIFEGIFSASFEKRRNCGAVIVEKCLYGTTKSINTLDTIVSCPVSRVFMKAFYPMHIKKNSRLSESNTPPVAYKTTALPSELNRQQP